MPYLNYINDEDTNISRGLVRNSSHIHKFGATPSMSISTTGTIWDINDALYPWDAFASANNVTIPAVNVSDNGKILTVQGLDSNWNFQSANVTLSSSGPVSSTETFKRVYRSFLATGNTNIGIINIQNGGSTNVARINAEKGQTLMSVFTVANNQTAYVQSISCTVEKGGDATVDLFVRPNNGPFRIRHTFEITSGSNYTHNFKIPLRFDELSDFDIRATMRSNNSRITANFDLLMLEPY